MNNVIFWRLFVEKGEKSFFLGLYHSSWDFSYFGETFHTLVRLFLILSYFPSNFIQIKVKKAKLPEKSKISRIVKQKSTPKLCENLLKIFNMTIQQDCSCKNLVKQLCNGLSY